MQQRNPAIRADRDVAGGGRGMRRIMIIRHAEKPGDADPDHGVSLNGVHDRHDLTVRGWQRAGALVRFFAPRQPRAADEPIAAPATIMASAAVPGSSSLRAQHTVLPLADALGIAVDATHANGEEVAVAASARAAPSTVLIAWHHNHIALLARAIGGAGIGCPRHWPDDRFDVVWVLDQARPDAPWTFVQVAQQLLAGDRADPIQAAPPSSIQNDIQLHDRSA